MALARARHDLREAKAMTFQPEDPSLYFVPLETAIVPPPGLINHLKDRWWAIHPEKGLIYYRRRRSDAGSPQCNFNEAVARSIRDRLYPWAEVLFVPSAFHCIDPQDYVS
jgi:hypothetical protein